MYIKAFGSVSFDVFFHILLVNGDALSDIVRQSYQTKLRFHFLIGFEVEAFEPVVELDDPEDGLRLYGSVAAMVDPAFACEKFLGLSPVCVVLVVDLYDSSVSSSLVALAPQRTSRTVPRTVSAYGGFISEVGFHGHIADVLHVLAHGAYEVVVRFVVVKILYEERGLTAFPFVLRMEHVVLDIRGDAIAEHVLVVLFAAVAGVGAHLTVLFPVPGLERVKEGDESPLVCRSPEDVVIGDELVLGGYLDIVSRLGLSVVHRVLLHPHESGVRVGFAEAVLFPQSFQLLLVFPHLRGFLALHFLWLCASSCR